MTWHADGVGPLSLAHLGALQEPTGTVCQVFISHAGEQMWGFVDFLLQEFTDRYPAVKVVLDDYSLPKGIELLPEIHAALQDALVGEYTTDKWLTGPHPYRCSLCVRCMYVCTLCMLQSRLDVRPLLVNKQTARIKMHSAHPRKHSTCILPAIIASAPPLQQCLCLVLLLRT
jgi:hypothetical protein